MVGVSECTFRESESFEIVFEKERERDKYRAVEREWREFEEVGERESEREENEGEGEWEREREFEASLLMEDYCSQFVLEEEGEEKGKKGEKERFTNSEEECDSDAEIVCPPLPLFSSPSLSPPLGPLSSPLLRRKAFISLSPSPSLSQFSLSLFLPLPQQSPTTSLLLSQSPSLSLPRSSSPLLSPPHFLSHSALSLSLFLSPSSSGPLSSHKEGEEDDSDKSDTISDEEKGSGQSEGEGEGEREVFSQIRLSLSSLDEEI